MPEPNPPIRSTQEDVIELAEDIDRFVIGLAERIDSIQDVEFAGKSAEVAELARILSTDSDRLGYPAMALSATDVTLAAEDGCSDALQETVIELTEIAQLIRQGHRGAA
jgi:hypothetical protein